MTYDLSKLYIDFTQCPKGTKLVDYFSELSSFKEFVEASDIEIKIAILSTDIESPFIRIKERETMVRSIFNYLALDEAKNKEMLKDIIGYKNETFNLCWIRYIQMLHDTEFTDWLLAKRDYDFFLQKSNEPEKETDNPEKYLARRNNIRETVSALGKQVKAIEAKIFPDSKAAREANMAELKNKIGLYAEKYGQEYTYL